LRLRAAAILVLALTAGGACTGQTSAASAPARVFVIVMENHSPDEVLQGRFTAELAATSGVANDYHAVAHPSVPNYLALTSGQTWGITDDSYHALPRADLGDQLTNAGMKWRAYMEGLTGAGCIDSPLPYDPGHNPFAFYGGGCPSEVVPYSQLGSDLGKGDVRFSWITPNMCHDQHSCPVSTGDDWLRGAVGQITASASWRAGSVLFITWDEDDGNSDNRVLTIVARPGHGHSVSSVAYDHYSLLATIEVLLGLPRLANAATAPVMSDLAG
jgi:phosphatidylinositol-3-phosphatase